MPTEVLRRATSGQSQVPGEGGEQGAPERGGRVCPPGGLIVGAPVLGAGGQAVVALQIRDVAVGAVGVGHGVGGRRRRPGAHEGGGGVGRRPDRRRRQVVAVHLELAGRRVGYFFISFKMVDYLESLKLGLRRDR